MVFELLFWILCLVIIYIYIGYPFLLKILGSFINIPIFKKDIEPNISMVISAYNEEKEIEKKIENSLNIDYPSEKLEIIIVSDASTDKTDDIVKKYLSKGIKYYRQDKQQGKTAALNFAVPKAQGEFILFTDANAMFQMDAIKKLVRNFADPKVGYVCGMSVYGNRNMSLVGDNESSYWDYETKIRSAENKIGSIVGSDGAIYMLRKELFTPLKDSDINDFVNPLQVIEKGYRGVFESEAMCVEDAGMTPDVEFRRKVRIVNRSLNGIFRVKSVMNPFKTGFFSVEIISHKLLRWFSPFLLFMVFILNIIIADTNILYVFSLGVQILFYLFAALGYWVTLNVKNASETFLFKIFHFPFYFVLINIASMLGIWNYLRGDIKSTWLPERKRI